MVMDIMQQSVMNKGFFSLWKKNAVLDCLHKKNRDFKQYFMN